MTKSLLPKYLNVCTHVHDINHKFQCAGPLTASFGVEGLPNPLQAMVQIYNAFECCDSLGGKVAF